jgi:hypothetical protein
MIFKMALIFLRLGGTTGQTINYCRASEKMSIVNLEDLCNWNGEDFQKEKQEDLERIMKDPLILNKIHSEVSGQGYRCYAKRKDFLYKRSFFRVDTVVES